ncbi:ISAs1 family transposase [Bacillus mycoides]|uniref:ISAs1 family transposase n=1 Tax=Bacillus mycoides TaxID=1405 RepID=UPI003D657BCC
MYTNQRSHHEKIINIDGKTMHVNDSKHHKASHIVSAWSKEDGVYFGQVTVNDKSNEITAIPKLLATLHLEKMIVTTDATGTQTNMVPKIVQKKADYVLAIKEHQKLLYQDIVDYFHHTPFLQRIKKDGKGCIQTIEKGHSQIFFCTRTICSGIDDRHISATSICHIGKMD